jgi:hypothetical protein
MGPLVLLLRRIWRSSYFLDRLYIMITGPSLKNGDSLDTYLLLSFVSKLLKLCGICYCFFTCTDINVHFAMNLSVFSYLLTAVRSNHLLWKPMIGSTYCKACLHVNDRASFGMDPPVVSSVWCDVSLHLSNKFCCYGELSAVGSWCKDASLHLDSTNPFFVGLFFLLK